MKPRASPKVLAPGLLKVPGVIPVMCVRKSVTSHRGGTPTDTQCLHIRLDPPNVPLLGAL